MSGTVGTGTGSRPSRGLLNSDLDQLQTSYRQFHDEPLDDDSEEEAPPSYQMGGPVWPNTQTSPARGSAHRLLGGAGGDKNTLGKPPGGAQGPGDDTPGDVMIHLVPEGNKSRWSHIEDLDSFFKNVYQYHQKHGFQVMMLQVSVLGFCY